MALSVGRAARSHFPLCLAWQTPPGPATKRFSFKPIHMQHWQKTFQRYRCVERAPQPIAALTSPINWVLCVDSLSPAPSGFAPELFAFIAAVIDEGPELGIRDGGARDRKRLDFDFVRIHLVVKDEWSIKQPAEKKPAPRYLCILWIF